MPGFGLFRLFFMAVLLLAACSKPTTSTPSPDAARANAAPADSQQATCCAQCTAAARRDPSGTRLDPTDCRKYMGTWNGQPGVDASCVAHFKDRPTTVGDCWQAFPDSK